MCFFLLERILRACSHLLGARGIISGSIFVFLFLRFLFFVSIDSTLLCTSWFSFFPYVTTFDHHTRTVCTMLMSTYVFVCTQCFAVVFFLFFIFFAISEFVFPPFFNIFFVLQSFILHKPPLFCLSLENICRAGLG